MRITFHNNFKNLKKTKKHASNFGNIKFGRREKENKNL